jgi:hypothetical protein
MPFSVTLDGIDELRSALRACDDQAGRLLLRATRIGLDEGRVLAKAMARRRTGALAESIVTRLLASSQRAADGEMIAGEPYASFVEGGTKAHEIRPRNAQALRFFVGGGVHFARVVHHPGTRAYPFVGPALEKWQRAAIRELESGLPDLQKILDGHHA